MTQWRCPLCGRKETEMDFGGLPRRQRAHYLANRLSGHRPRYGGVSRPLSDAEWNELIATCGDEFGLQPGMTATVSRRRISGATAQLCGECHEEILSEPLYFPEAISALGKIFRGRSRVERIVTLARVIKAGAAQLVRRRGTGKRRQ